LATAANLIREARWHPESLRNPIAPFCPRLFLYSPSVISSDFASIDKSSELKRIFFFYNWQFFCIGYPQMEGRRVNAVSKFGAMPKFKKKGGEGK
jgi:hypothetical protein